MSCQSSPHLWNDIFIELQLYIVVLSLSSPDSSELKHLLLQTVLFVMNIVKIYCK